MIPDLTWYFFNFSVVVIGLFFLLRKPAKEFLQNRHVTLRDEIRGAAERLTSARAQNQIFEENFKGLDRETAQIEAQAQRDAEEEKSRVLGLIRRNSEAIVSDAKAASASLGNRLKSELLRDLGNQVLDRTEKSLRSKLTGADKLRLQKLFSSEMEKSS